VIDVAMYAEALVSVYRFLPVEDALPLFVICAEPERSEAVKTCVVRACLTLAEEVRRIKWQKPLDKLEDAMRDRLRSIFQSVGLRHPEVDQNGSMKRAAGRPRGARIIPQPLTDREVLLHGILLLWRVHPMFHFQSMTEQEVEEWVTTADRIWQTPIDNSVKISGATALQVMTENLFAACANDTAQPQMITFLKIALSVQVSFT
jgi:hypothetical protein